MLLLDTDAAVGEVFNVGNTTDIAIMDLAETVIDRAGSSSRIRLVPLEVAYEPGFEEVSHRRPDTAALTAATGWTPNHTVEDAIDDVIAYERGRVSSNERVRVA